MSDKQHILVTGAAGFIGSNLVDRLLAMDESVIGVDNFDPFYSADEKRANLARARLNASFRFVEADCTNTSLLERLFGHDQIGAIIHLAGKAGVRPSIADPQGYIHANVQGTQAILEFARRREIRQILLGSSSSVYGNETPPPFSEDAPADRPVSPYAASKRSAELLCSTYSNLFGINIIALRFFTVYGPRQRPDLAIRKFSSLMLRGSGVPCFGDGMSARDYTWIDDILDGVTSGLKLLPQMSGSFEIINLGGNRTTTLSRLIQMLGEALGVKPRLKHFPMQRGDVNLTYADVRKANRLLGYVPRTPIEDGIRRFANWIVEHEAGRTGAAGSSTARAASGKSSVISLA